MLQLLLLLTLPSSALLQVSPMQASEAVQDAAAGIFKNLCELLGTLVVFTPGDNRIVEVSIFTKPPLLQESSNMHGSPIPIPIPCRVK